MSYIKRVVILANSYKPPSGRCIAGKEIVGEQVTNWVRPVSTRPTAEVSFSEYRYENYTSPHLLDIVDIPLLKTAPTHHQTENETLDPTSRWVKRGDFPWVELPQILDHPNSLWINSDHTNSGFYDCISEAEASTVQNSLLLVRPENFAVLVGRNGYTGKRIYRADFEYNGTHHNLSITDPVVRDKFAAREEGRYPLGNCILCVSLTEPYEIDGRCHKLVAAIVSNPPL